MQQFSLLLFSTAASADFAGVLNSTLNFYYEQAVAEFSDTPMGTMRSGSMGFSELGPTITGEVEDYAQCGKTLKTLPLFK